MVDPTARLREEQELGFAEVLAWLHSAIGAELGVEASPRDGLEVLRLRGKLERGGEAWPHPEAPLLFEIGGVELCLWPRHFDAAWRLHYELDGGEEVEALEIELDTGMTLTLDAARIGVEP
jgi:hypothetical protein